jgi:hypothetical protein
MKIRFRTDVERSGEQSRRQQCSVNPTSSWSPRGLVSSGIPPTQNPADHSLRRGAACCARFSAADQSLRRGAGAWALFASRMSSRGCARRSVSDRRHPLANSGSRPAIRLPLIICPQFDYISNRNWPTNRSYRKQKRKPCLTGTGIARCDSSELSIPVGRPLRRNR